MSDKHWIQTFSGRKFYPLQPDWKQLDIRDIARALSMLCRYVGHVSRFYSVAEHSVRVSREIERRLVEEQGYAEEDQFVLYNARWGLMHDASEAYLGDVSRPVKVQPELEGYRTKERVLQAEIVKWCGLQPSEPQIVQDVDTAILGSEARQLKSPVHPDWGKTTKTGELPPDFPGVVNMGWPPAKAEEIFLKRYQRLFGAGAIA